MLAIALLALLSGGVSAWFGQIRRTGGLGLSSRSGSGSHSGFGSGSRSGLRMAEVESAPASATAEFGLTPVLQTYAEGLHKVVDDKLRYQQLLYLAANCPPMDAALKVDANKVPGCLSVVHVHATMSGGDNSQDPQGNQSQGTLTFQGDSDSQLTKGLVTMLVRGLSGHTAEEIEAVDPRFIQYAGVAQSLTPGRNNGFLNMLGLMKRQARALADGAKAVDAGGAGAEAGAEAGAVGAASGGEGGPMQRSIRSKLSLLQPQLLEVEDESYKHAGHAGVREMQAAGVGAGGETHFNVKVVATCFGGLSRVQRHQMVYTLLRAELDAGVHALSIVAKTPDEV